MSGQMTELDAVNEVLSAVGQQPAQTLEAGTYIEAVRIKQMLNRLSREVQSRGWWFNEEEDITLQPDPTGNIKLGTNIINATVLDDRDGSLVQRGVNIYDRKNRTYEIKGNIKVNVCLFLTWEELPQVAKEYITSLTAVKFNSGYTNLQDIIPDLQSTMTSRYAQMLIEDTRSRDINLLRKTRIRGIAFNNRRN